MRKILASLIAAIIVLTSFSMVAFAAPTDGLIYFGENAETTFSTTEESITLPLYVMPNEDMLYETGGVVDGFTNLAVYYSYEGCTVDVSKGSVDFGGKLDSKNPGTDAVLLGKGSGAYNSYSAGNPILLANVTFVKSAGAETATVTLTSAGIYNQSYKMQGITLSSPITITWKEDEPVGPTTVEKGAEIKETVINAGDKDWTWDDAKSYLISAEAVADATEIVCKIDATYDKSEETNKTKTIFNESVKGIVIKGESTVSFRTVLLNTDEITNLRLDGTFIFTK